MHCAQDHPAEPEELKWKTRKWEKEDNTLCKEGEIKKEARGHE